MSHSVLLHELTDDVGVAVRDIKAGEKIGLKSLEGQEGGEIVAATDVPLGHKIALRDIPAGKDVIEYGRAIGRAQSAIPCGGHVHTQNLRTLRWNI